MEEVKIAILGLNQGYKFAKDALDMPGVKLVAVAGNDKLSEQRARELNVPLYKDYKQLLEECELDGVIIALPNGLHREATELAASKKLHVLVEKPIAPTIEDGEAMIKACKEHNVKMLVGHHRRFSSKLVKLKEVISTGVIGDLVGVNMFYMIAKDRPYFAEKWRLTEGGGPILINGIHDIDTLRFLTGLTINSVYAAIRNSIRNNPVEDSASVIMETEEGPIVNYFLSDGVPSPWSYDLNAKENKKFSHFDDDCYKFFGTKGSLAFPSMNFYYYEDNQFGWEHPLKVKTFEIDENDPMTDELKHFIEMLRNDDVKPLVTGEDALETLRVTMAIKKSAKHSQKVLVQEDKIAIAK
ncbi:Gfo/Idh/MocA family oxidoreductase [Caldifermentibacillus hisashii]|jgi:predicted dehydrogenase|uniref:Gfo/Idh/MocA family protein n=1 Tax=Caldifermentibacillus hisashii TaxID=996558 RepID=UPI0031FC23B3